MLKKSISFILLMCIALTMFSFSVSAAGTGLAVTFDLTSKGENEITAVNGEEITVLFTIDRTDGNGYYEFNVFQNEIIYDQDFFEFVEATPIESEATALFQTRNGGINIIKTTSMLKTFESNTEYCSIKFKVKAISGSGWIKCDAAAMYDIEGELADLTEKNLKVTIAGTTTVPVTGVSVSPTTMTLTSIGETQKLTTTITPDNASNKGVSYLSSNTSVATVGADGTVRAVSEGTATITVTTDDGGKTATCTVTVRKPSGGTPGVPAAPVVKEYTLMFDTNGGTQINSVKANEGTKVSLGKYVSEKTGYKFDGWYSDKELTKKITEVTLNKDTTVYAKWVVSEDKPIVEKPDYKPGILTDEHYAYIVGREGGMIAPESDITRAEVATIIYRLLDQDERNKAKTKENVFIDVNEGDWFNTAVSTLASLKLVNGRTTDSFAPNEFITRAELATIFARMVEVEYDGKVLFGDVSGHWAESYINEAATAEWIVGYNGLFRPDDNITRAEVMTLVNRVLNREPESKDDMIGNMISWKDNADETAWYYLAVQEATNSHTYNMKSDGVHEKWTSLTKNPDWTKIEE